MSLGEESYLLVGRTRTTEAQTAAIRKAYFGEQKNHLHSQSWRLYYYHPLALAAGKGTS